MRSSAPARSLRRRRYPRWSGSWVGTPSPSTSNGPTFGHLLADRSISKSSPAPTRRSSATSTITAWAPRATSTTKLSRPAPGPGGTLATVEEPRAATGSFIRPDGKEKVTGVGRYAADLNLTGQLHAKFRYADHSHARVRRIDTATARALPGVLAVLTHEDVPDVKYG